ncbi:leucine-rich repeat domain-containing protein [Candidatus Methanoprimaticola sp. MG2]|uniref:leucine-rich repeat domain-containing protein n=1 Tax=Candidatus Methanoprimaticola sp. MG2 TaxID=3228838 RepID=UPI0039C5E076
MASVTTKSFSPPPYNIMNGKSIVLILAAMTAVFAVAFISFSSEDLEAVNKPTSGNCGDNIQWTYDSSTNTLDISGYGPMYDYKGGNWPGLNTMPGNVSYDIDTVIIRGNITSIGDNAFKNCSMDAITLPNSLEFIGASAFENCYHLTEISLPDSVTTIENYAFKGCRNLTSIDLSNNVSTLPSGVFNGCNNLKNLSVPEEAISFGIDGVPNITLDFSDCHSLESINVGVIANKTLDVPDSVHQVIINRNNTTLTTLNLGSGVSEIQLYGSSINNISVDRTNPDLTVIDNVVFSKDMHTLIWYPMGLTSNAYVIHDDVTAVGTIENANLKLLTFGKNVTEVYRVDCPNLEILNVPAGLKFVAPYLPSKIAIVPMDYHTEDFIEGGILIKYYSKYIDLVTATPLNDGTYRIHVEFNDDVDYSSIRIGSQYNLGDVASSGTNDFVLPKDASGFMKLYLSLDTGIDELPPSEWVNTSDDPTIGDKIRQSAALILLAIIIIVAFSAPVIYVKIIR